MTRIKSFINIFLVLLACLTTIKAKTLTWKKVSPRGVEFHNEENIEGKLDVVYYGTIFSRLQITWTFHYRHSNKSWEPYIQTRVYVPPESNATVDFGFPRFEAESFSLPGFRDNEKIYYAVRTICTVSAEAKDKDQEKLEISISTTSTEPINYTLFVSRRFIDLFRPREKHIATVSPVSPVYYRLQPFKFPSNSEYVTLNVQLLKGADADKTSDACFTVSIQHEQCPVQDYHKIVGGRTVYKFHTMSTTTTLQVLREVFHQEDYLVFMMHNNYSLCKTSGTEIVKQPLFAAVRKMSNRGKEFDAEQLEFSFTESVSDTLYICVVFGTIIFHLIVCGGIAFLYKKCSDAVTPLHHEIMPETEESSEYYHCMLFFYVRGPASRANVSLQRLCVKSQPQVSKNAMRYCGTFWVASLFYIIPVFQFVLLYQHFYLREGNEDQCYFNFKCLHPYKHLMAFNHVFSNVGYVILGCLFILIVRFDHHRYIKRVDMEENNVQGLFAQYGLYYAMGSCLIMEGAMSALYHVCPTQLNFQFDTSFMYVNAIICLVTIYRSRHMDSNSNANSISTFLTITLTMFFVVVITFYSNWWLWVIVTGMHMMGSLIMSVQLYSWGDWKFVLFSSGDTFKLHGASIQEKMKSSVKSILFPFSPSIEPMTVALMVLNFLNWMLTVVAYIKFYPTEDIATYVLSIFLLNLAAYMGIYITFKMWVAKERILWSSWLYLGLAVPFWIVGMVLFSSETASWNLSFAESREVNNDCVLFKFYDYHDIWHFLSAFGLFFTFMFLFTVDDGLKFTDRSMIKIF